MVFYHSNEEKLTPEHLVGTVWARGWEADPRTRPCRNHQGRQQQPEVTLARREGFCGNAPLPKQQTPALSPREKGYSL